MKTIGPEASARSAAQRVFLAFMGAVAMIAGLLAMHSIADPGPGSGTHVTATPIGAEPAAHTAIAGDAAAQAAHDPAAATLCGLVLAGTVIVAVSFVLIARLGVAAFFALPLRLHEAIAALPPPRPPSLLVLSISRT